MLRITLEFKDKWEVDDLQEAILDRINEMENALEHGGISLALENAFKEELPLMNRLWKTLEDGWQNPDNKIGFNDDLVEALDRVDTTMEMLEQAIKDVKGSL